LILNLKEAKNKREERVIAPSRCVSGRFTRKSTAAIMVCFCELARIHHSTVKANNDSICLTQSYSSPLPMFSCAYSPFP